MSRIWSIMDIGKQSMMNSQAGLQTVSHNIANKNVAGYSRQRVDIETAVPTSDGRLQLGNGAVAAKVVRIQNPFIEKQLVKQMNTLGNYDARANLMARVEQVFNEQQNKGLNKSIGDFFNSYREMANDPENLALRDQVKQNGEFMAKDFQRVSHELHHIQDQADFQIHTEISKINGITGEIADLNQKIATIEVTGATANDERDRRGQLVKELSKMININYAENKAGELTVTAANSAILVSGGSHRKLIAQSTGARNGKAEGNVDIFFQDTADGTPICITDRIKGGSLGGLLNVRDKYINNTINQVDDLAYTMANDINRVHKSGYDRLNRKGVDFFTVGGDEKGAASRIEVNSLIREDPGRIVSAAQPNAPGDNRIANVISSLQYENKMGNGQSTFDGFYNNIVGDVGVTAARDNSEKASQNNIVDQLTNIRNSISGVSLDEETTKMIEYQKTFEASARLIKVADEMMNTIMHLKD